MNKLKTFKKVIYNACLYFTIAIFFVLVIANAASLATATEFLSLSSTALIFLACLAISALNLVWKSDYSTSVRLLIHFTGSLLSYALIYILIPGKSVYTNLSQVVIRAAFFVIPYLVIAFIILLVGSIFKNRRSEDMEYESQFGDFSDK